MTARLVRAEPRTVGTHFLGGEIPGDHQCRPACYRSYDKRGKRAICTLCDYGHSAGWHDTGPGSYFAGSAFQASLNNLPAFAPFVLAPASEGSES